MPLGAFRINSLAKFTVTAVAEVIRRKKGITAIGNAQVDTAQSKFGGASALFDGTGDSVQAGPSSDFAFGTGNFTMEAWVRVSSASNDQTIIDGRNFGIPVYNNVLKIGGNYLQWSDGSAWRVASTTFPTNTWTHVAVCRNNGILKLFQNGSEVYSATNTVNISSDRYISIGGSNGGGGFSPLEVVNGHIDEVRVSNSARYTSNFTPSTTPFVNDANTLLLIHADGTDASTYFEDDNGVRSKKGITAIGNAQIDNAQSKFGNTSALFDGSGDYLQLANDSDLTFAGDFTLECWYRLPGAVPGIGAFFYNNHLFYITNDGGVAKYAVFSSGSNRLLTSSLGTVSANTWYHVAFQRSGSTLSAYHNGTLISSSTYTGTMTSQTANYIGFYPGSSFFNGHIDEYRISSTARYSSNFTPSTTAFVNDSDTRLLLHMDGTDASTLFKDDNGATKEHNDDSNNVALLHFEGANNATTTTDDNSSGRTARTYTFAGNAKISTDQFYVGTSSAVFDGAGDKISTSSLMAIGTSNCTIECWVRPIARTRQYPVIMSNYPTGGFNTSSWVLMDRHDAYNTKFTFFASNFNNSSPLLTSTTSVVNNTWYHLAIVRSSNSWTLYVNGISEATATWSGSLDSNGAGAVGDTGLSIGTAIDTAESYHGYIDEIRISKTARYTSKFAPNP